MPKHEASAQRSAPTSPFPEKAPGPRWTTDRGAMPGEPFAWLDGDADTARAAMVEVLTTAGSHFEVYAPGGDLIASASTPLSAAARAESLLPLEA